jgi:hypothetical protein
MMSDRVFYPLAALVAVLLIALAAVYPQGMGARSPKPFGHVTETQLRAAAAARAPKEQPKLIDANDLKGPL